MKKLLFFIFILFSASLFSQAIRFELGYSLLRYIQKGELYSVDPNHVPNWYEVSTVNRKLRSSGLVVTGYYPLNFGHRTYEYFSCGPQVGFIINTSSTGFSVDENYDRLPTKMNMRVPLLFSFRLGSMNAVYQRKVGIAIAGGIEMMQLQLADQTGTFYLPMIQSSFAINRFLFNVNAYPMDIESVYLINGEETPRLTTSLLEFQFLVAIDFYGKRYRNDSRTQSKNSRRR